MILGFSQILLVDFMQKSLFDTALAAVLRAASFRAAAGTPPGAQIQEVYYLTSENPLDP